MNTASHHTRGALSCPLFQKDLSRKNRFAVRLLVFIGILVLLNAGFGVAGGREHIDILGSVVLTLWWSQARSHLDGLRSKVSEAVDQIMQVSFDAFSGVRA